MSDPSLKDILLNSSNKRIHKDNILSSEIINNKNILYGYDFYSFLIKGIKNILRNFYVKNVDIIEVKHDKHDPTNVIQDKTLELESIVFFAFRHRGEIGFIGLDSIWASIFINEKNFDNFSDDPAIRSYLEFLSLNLVNSINSNFNFNVDDKVLLSSDQYFTIRDPELVEKLKTYLKFSFLINNKEHCLYYFMTESLLDPNLPRFPSFNNRKIASDNYGLVKLEVFYAVIPISLNQVVNLKKAGSLINIHEHIDLSSAYLSVNDVERGKLRILLEDNCFVFELLDKKNMESKSINFLSSLSNKKSDKNFNLSLRILNKEASFLEYQKNSIFIRSEMSSIPKIEILLSKEVIGSGTLVELNGKIHLKVL